jgi:hypothetical protein
MDFLAKTQVAGDQLAEDGFVYAVDARTLDAQYMLRVVSLDGAPSSGGSRVPSAVLGAGSYNGYAYITGTAGNYYLEFTPFNPSNITGTATRNTFTLTTGGPDLTELRNFQLILTTPLSLTKTLTPAPQVFTASYG